MIRTIKIGIFAMAIVLCLFVVQTVMAQSSVPLPSRYDNPYATPYKSQRISGSCSTS